MAPPASPEFGPIAGLPAGMGQLRIDIRWPGRNVQGIPLSARKLKFRIKQGATEKAYREVDQSTTTTAFILRAGSYDLEVGAHPGTVDSVDYSGTEIAAATSSVVIFSSVVTSAGIALEPKFAPQFGSFDDEALAAGNAFAIPGGSNLKPAWVTSDPVVTFPTGGGTGTATAPVTFPGGVPTFTVPAGADPAGAFTVTQDGVAKSFPYSQGASAMPLAKNLTFTVAGTDNPVTFTAPVGQGGTTCTFAAAGTWKDCQVTGCFDLGPDGRAGSLAGGNPAPLAPKSALVVSLDGGSTWQLVGRGPRAFKVTSGQTLRFKANDTDFGNNSGLQTVTYTCSWTKTGTLAIDANASTGTSLQVPAQNNLSCRFQVVGNQKWSFVDGGSADLDAAGVPVDSGGAPTGVPATAAGSTYTLPSGNAGALIVKRGDNSYEPAGKDRVIAVNSGEVLRFLINDVTTGYATNPGSLTASYSCSASTFGNSDVTVQ